MVCFSTPSCTSLATKANILIARWGHRKVSKAWCTFRPPRHGTLNSHSRLPSGPPLIQSTSDHYTIPTQPTLLSFVLHATALLACHNIYVAAYLFNVNGLPPRLDVGVLFWIDPNPDSSQMGRSPFDVS